MIFGHTPLGQITQRISQYYRPVPGLNKLSREPNHGESNLVLGIRGCKRIAKITIACDQLSSLYPRPVGPWGVTFRCCAAEEDGKFFFYFFIFSLFSENKL